MKSRDFMGTPGSRGPTFAVLTYAFSECARSGPRRRPTIWRTWTPIRSPRIGGTRLSGRPADILEMQRGALDHRAKGDGGVAAAVGQGMHLSVHSDVTRDRGEQAGSSQPA